MFRDTAGPMPYRYRWVSFVAAREKSPYLPESTLRTRLAHGFKQVDGPTLLWFRCRLLSIGVDAVVRSLAKGFAMSRSTLITADIDYPDSDGQPMAETDFQRDVMTYVIETLKIHFRERPSTFRAICSSTTKRATGRPPSPRTFRGVRCSQSPTSHLPVMAGGQGGRTS